MVADRRSSIEALVLCFLGALAGREVAADSCVTFTSTVDGAGDPGPGSDLCLPYTVEVSAVAGTVALAEASASAAAQAPAMDISVLVDESGSVKLLCARTLDCYEDEKNFALELIALLDDSVGCVTKARVNPKNECSSDACS